MKNKGIMEEIWEAIDQAETIGLASHISPDGDNLGSLLGLTLALENLGKNATPIQVDDIPKPLQFLPNLEKLQEIGTQKFDLFITVDCGDLNRIGDAVELFQRSNKTINIDHHQSNDFFADLNYVKPSISSTAELVYQLLQYRGIPMTKEIATLLFIGINTDTYRYLYDSANAETLRIGANLLEAGIDKEWIYRNLYQSAEMNAKRCELEVLSKAFILHDNQVAVTMVSLEQLERYQVKAEEISDLVNYFRDINGMELSIHITEKEEGCKLSFRSKQRIDVSELAKDFNGGGHIRAAGARSELSMEKTYQKLEERLKQIDWSRNKGHH